MASPKYMNLFIFLDTNWLYLNCSIAVNSSKMLSWKDEMGYMLSVIERQVKCSLGKIELTFKRDGLSFDDEFKQYFMWASNHRSVNQSETPMDFT